MTLAWLPLLCRTGALDARSIRTRRTSAVRQALPLAWQLSHPFSVAFGLGHRAVLHQFRREGRATCESAQELITFCTEKGFSQWVAMGTILHGWGLAAQGQGEMGMVQMREGLLSSQNAGTKLGQAPVLAQLAEVYWRTGQTYSRTPGSDRSVGGRWTRPASVGGRPRPIGLKGSCCYSRTFGMLLEQKRAFSMP